MSNDWLLSNKKDTDTWIEQTKTKPQQTFELKLNKQRETFSFSPPINLIEEGNWMIAVTFFEATNSVFKTTKQYNSFSTTIPGHWNTKSLGKTTDELDNLLELRSQNATELHVKQVSEKGIGLIKDQSSNLEFLKNETLEELKNAKYNVPGVMVFRMQLTYDEIIKKIDLKHIPSKRRGYSPHPGTFDFNDLNKTLEYIFTQYCECKS